MADNTEKVITRTKNIIIAHQALNEILIALLDAGFTVFRSNPDGYWLNNKTNTKRYSINYFYINFSDNPDDVGVEVIADSVIGRERFNNFNSIVNDVINYVNELETQV